MTVFQTPEPITVSLEFGVGDLRLVASDRTETVVEVGPSDPTKAGDVNAAKQTRVEYASGSLLVRAPKNWRLWTPWGGRDSIDVEIQLPEGSRVSADVAMASVRGTGRLGELDIKTGMGDVCVDQAGPVKVRTGFGEVMIGRAGGDADVKTGSGRIDLGSVEGSATLKNSNGDTRIGEVHGRAQLQNANGAIEVESARSDVTARTALGDVRLGLVSHGATEAKTAYGQIDIGVLDGVAAWLDLSTGFGRVSNELEDTGRPPAGEQTTEIHAHTAAGDINICRVPARLEMETRIMSIAPPVAIAASGVCKSYGERSVLDRVDLFVGAGTIFALLGPNGAGKTTMVRILSTLIEADAGEVLVAGHDARREADLVRGAIGVTGQFSAVDELMTGEENLRLMTDVHHLGRSRGRARADELLARFELTSAAAKPVMTYSGGMRRRLDLAMTLVGSPSVIFLDEPTTGLDPRSRRTMWEIIRELVADGVTIFLTTQYLDEADRLADQIAVLDRGRIVAEGSAEALKRRLPGGHFRLEFADPVALRRAKALIDGAIDDEEKLILEVPSDTSLATLRLLLDRLDDAHAEVEHLSIHAPHLDDVFFAVTGQAVEEEVLVQ